MTCVLFLETIVIANRIKSSAAYYMTYSSSTWLYNSRDACCTRYYSYDYAACMGIDQLGAIGFYPAWESGENKCVNDTDIPDYMRNNEGENVACSMLHPSSVYSHD